MEAEAAKDSASVGSLWESACSEEAGVTEPPPERPPPPLLPQGFAPVHRHPAPPLPASVASPLASQASVEEDTLARKTFLAHVRGLSDLASPDGATSRPIPPAVQARSALAHSLAIEWLIATPSVDDMQFVQKFHQMKAFSRSQREAPFLPAMAADCCMYAPGPASLDASSASSAERAKIRRALIAHKRASLQALIESQLVHVSNQQLPAAAVLKWNGALQEATAWIGTDSNSCNECDDHIFELQSLMHEFSG